MAKRSHKKGILGFLLAAIVLGIIINNAIYSKEYPLIEIDKINNVNSQINHDGYESINIKEDDHATYIIVKQAGYIVDNDDLFAILSRYKSKRTRHHYFPYHADDIVAEISLIQGHKPKHILLGKINVWYESSDKAIYDILDGDQLLKEILTLVKEKEAVWQY